MTDRILLYEHPVSSYVQKVKIALREKNIPFETIVPEDLGNVQPGSQFAKANPRGEVPVLVNSSVTLFDSTVILEYLEDRFPVPPLLPRDPAARAFARLTEEICDTQYEAVNWGIGELRWFKRAGEADSELATTMEGRAKHQTEVIFAWLASRLGTADYFTGDTFGWADLCVAPYFNRSVTYGLAPAADAPLMKWHARIKQRPSVATTFEEFEAGVAKMPGAAKIYMSGERRREYRDHRLDWMMRSGGVDIVLEGLKDNNIRFSWPDA